MTETDCSVIISSEAIGRHRQCAESRIEEVQICGVEWWVVRPDVNHTISGCSRTLRCDEVDVASDRSSASYSTRLQLNIPAHQSSTASKKQYAATRRGTAADFHLGTVIEAGTAGLQTNLTASRGIASISSIDVDRGSEST